MSFVASDFVLALEHHRSALERALESAVAVVEHNQKCRNCRIFGNKCHEAGVMTRQMYIYVKEAKSLEDTILKMQTKPAERAYDLVEHISQDEKSPYKDIALTIVQDRKRVSDGT